jgi:hypothetical protein
MPTTSVTLATYNVNNLFLRYKFGRTFPGDMSKKSVVKDVRWGYVPMYKPGLFTFFDEEKRKLEARSVKVGGDYPDILCLQEVESLQALRSFNEAYLGGHYSHALLIDSRDMRQIDVGVLSTRPFLSVRSNVDLPDDKDPAFPWTFSRDCLEVTVDIGTKQRPQRLTVFVNHFKSKLVTGKTKAQKAAATARADAKRERQARCVARIVHDRFPGTSFRKDLFAVVGDFNDGTGSRASAILENEGLENCLDRLPQEERWTEYYRGQGTVSQFDHLLLSPALARRTAGIAPVVERQGIGFRDFSARTKTALPRNVRLDVEGRAASPLTIPFGFKRFSNVSKDLYASDHCPVMIRIPL